MASSSLAEYRPVPGARLWAASTGQLAARHLEVTASLFPPIADTTKAASAQDAGGERHAATEQSP